MLSSGSRGRSRLSGPDGAHRRRACCRRRVDARPFVEQDRSSPSLRDRAACRGARASDLTSRLSPCAPSARFRLTMVAPEQPASVKRERFSSPLRLLHAHGRVQIGASAMAREHSTVNWKVNYPNRTSFGGRIITALATALAALVLFAPLASAQDVGTIEGTVRAT